MIFWVAITMNIVPLNLWIRPNSHELDRSTLSENDQQTVLTLLGPIYGGKTKYNVHNWGKGQYARSFKPTKYNVYE